MHRLGRKALKSAALDKSEKKEARTACAIMDQSDSGRIAALLDDFNTVAWPH